MGMGADGVNNQLSLLDVYCDGLNPAFKLLDLYSTHMHLFSFHTAEFLDHFWEQFIAEVDASSAIVLELEHRGNHIKW